MVNDVSRVLKRWQEPLNITRKIASGSYTDGNWVNSADEVIAILAVIQSMNPDDLILLPEGTRTTEAVKVHTTSTLKTVSEVGETNADTFVYDNLTYLVYSVFPRKIGNYTKAIAIRITNDVPEIPQ